MEPFSPNTYQSMKRRITTRVGRKVFSMPENVPAISRKSESLDFYMVLFD